MASITSEAFLHPLDQSAMKVMQDWMVSKPAVEKRVHQIMDAYLEKAAFFNLADNTRVSSRQAPTLHEAVKRASDGLGMSMPSVFLDTSPFVNASAISGTESASLVFTSALVEGFNVAEIAAVAGHELGHILADHSFFRAASGSSFEVIDRMLSAIPGGSLVALGLQWLLHDWFRKAELTADRAALVATSDVEAVQSMIIKLAGGTEKDRISRSEFLDQASEFRELLRDRDASLTIRKRIGVIAAALLAEGGMRTHPWPALRYLEISEWADSEQYEAIVAGEIATAVEIGRESRITDDKSAPEEDDLTLQVRRVASGLKEGWQDARGKTTDASSVSKALQGGKGAWRSARRKLQNESEDAEDARD